MILGLQQNPNNTQHQCYVSFGTFKGDIQKMPDYIDAVSNSSNTDNSVLSALDNYKWCPLGATGNSWCQPNTYFKMLKRGQELSALFFNVFE